ncbi:MAG: NeuD/PglB/VioB family sugar acetyltransferase [Cellulophaga sp.]
MSLLKNTIILGAGSYGEVFLTYLLEQGFNVIGFYDDDPSRLGKKIHGVKVLGNFKDLFTVECKQNIHKIFCPIGNNIIREKYLKELFDFGYETPNLIHKSVILNKDVTIGNGVYLLPGVIIMPYTKISDYVIISVGSNISHHTVIKKGVFISTGVNVGANITINSKAFLGISSTIMTGVTTVGTESTIGCGAVVIKDVEDYHIMAGVPAKTLRIKTPYN